MKNKLTNIIKSFGLILFVYCFLIGIKLIGSAFKLFGSGFAEQLISTTSNPLVGLSIGILATSIIQSSSTTTSIVVGLVAGNALTVVSAIPIIMGANIGTTITNTIVSLAHITRRNEFKKAFSGAVLHDFFNIFSLIILFPVELMFHPIAATASLMSSAFFGIEGMTFVSPLKVIIIPIVIFIEELLQKNAVAILFVGLGLIFVSLKMIVSTMKSLVIEKIEGLLDSYFFKTSLIAFSLGLVFTALVQSSSITTSLMIPLVGAGMLSLEKLFPYVLGANIGTTVTALLASLATDSINAVTIAFAHLTFNIFGIIIAWPFRKYIINAAKKMGEIVFIRKKMAIIYMAIVFYLIPFIIIITLK